MDQTVNSSSDQPTMFATLQQFLSKHPIFGTLNDAEILELAGMMEVLGLEAGETLFRQGDPGDSVYLVLSGSLEVSVEADRENGILVGLLREGDIVGEIALMTSQRRAATVAARECARLLRLSTGGFAFLEERHPQMIQELSRQVLPRFRHTQLVNILKGLFGAVDLPAFQEIENQLAWKHLLPGEILFRQGDPADSLYFVISGRLRIVIKPGEGIERVIGEVGRGDFTGEFGLITKEPRSATVYAVRDSEVVQFSMPLFEQLMAHHAPAMLQLTRLIVQRVTRFNQSRPADRPTFSAIAVAPVHPSVPVEAFTAQLYAALSQHGSVLQLNSRSFDDLYNRPGAAQTGPDHPNEVLIQGWFAEKESQHAYILYQADQTLTPWTRRCLAQSDRVLLVGDATMSPALGEIEQAAENMHLMAQQDLVLLHPRSQNCASGTKQWLESRHAGSHHHIRPDMPRDFQRLVRRLTGRATGLVLGGGGARGWAHLGVIQALQEAGVEIDLIGGSSMGALISGAYASGYSIAEMAEFGRAFSNPKQLLDYTLPFVSLTSSRKLTTLMRHIFKDAQIEDLCLPYFCVSSNLTRAEPMIHRAGPLWESVRASLAIPGIFTPVLHGSDVLVDGGEIDNFPIDVMRELCEGGCVIGINVAPKHEPSKDFSFGPSISGWQVLWGKVWPFGDRQKVPSILSTLIRSSEIKGLYKLRSAQEKADLILEPPVDRFASLDFARYEEIIDIGYQYASDFLSKNDGLFGS